MSDSSVTLNPGSGGPQVRTETTNDTLGQTPDQGYVEAHQQVVITAEDDGDITDRSFVLLLSDISGKLDIVIDLLSKVADEDDRFGYASDAADRDDAEDDVQAIDEKD